MISQTVETLPDKKVSGSMLQSKPVSVGMIFLGRKRPGFDMSWGAQMEKKVRASLATADITIFEPPQKAVDDNSLRQAVAACQAREVEVLVLLQTSR